MMSLAKVNMWDVVKKQYRYKLKSYSQVLVSLMMIQLLAVVFSLNSVSSSATSSNTLDLEIRYYSADIVVGFTILWGFITAIITTTKAHRHNDLIFISNRLCSNLSNLLILLTASIVGGITAMLSGFLLKLIILFKNNIIVDGMTGISPSDLLLGIVTTSLYIFLFCAIGYLAGTLVNLNRIFIILLPALLIGSVFLAGTRGKSGAIENFFILFFTENSLPLFIAKVLIAAVLFFAGAFALSNRMEVKP